MLTHIRKKLQLNVKPTEAAIRVLLAFGVTSLIIVLHNTILITFVCIIATYLFVTSLLMYCPLKALFIKQTPQEQKEMPVKDL